MAFLKGAQIIEKRNSTNYSKWKLKMEMLLIKEDLFEAINETPPTPISIDSSRKRSEGEGSNRGDLS